MSHGIQAAIMAAIGDGWVTAAQLERKLDQWSTEFIRQQLRYLHREGFLLRSYEVRDQGGAMTARYAHERPQDEIDKLIIRRRRRHQRPHAGVLPGLVEAFNG